MGGMNLERPPHPDPYSLLPMVPSFTVTSEDFASGGVIPREFSAEGHNISPQLSWSGFPPQTQSFAITMFDPDAPVPAGWWHWSVVDLPADVTELPSDAGQSDLMLPGAAFHLRHDGGEHAYGGPFPPIGDRPHRYYFAVTALDVDTLDVTDEDSCTRVAFAAWPRALARAVLVGTYQR